MDIYTIELKYEILNKGWIDWKIIGTYTEYEKAKKALIKTKDYYIEKYKKEALPKDVVYYAITLEKINTKTKEKILIEQ